MNKAMVRDNLVGDRRTSEPLGGRPSSQRLQRRLYNRCDLLVARRAGKHGRRNRDSGYPIPCPH